MCPYCITAGFTFTMLDSYEEYLKPEEVWTTNENICGLENVFCKNFTIKFKLGEKSNSTKKEARKMKNIAKIVPKADEFNKKLSTTNDR